ncbi:MAG: hypothetical protein FJ088_04190, partial [Deltaproteobacteria bacterium]|nr:hypothetical protein [Deltaproteobacteria bacterium]
MQNHLKTVKNTVYPVQKKDSPETAKGRNEKAGMLGSLKALSFKEQMEAVSPRSAVQMKAASPPQLQMKKADAVTSFSGTTLVYANEKGNDVVQIENPEDYSKKMKVNLQPGEQVEILEEKTPRTKIKVVQGFFKDQEGWINSSLLMKGMSGEKIKKQMQAAKKGSIKMVFIQNPVTYQSKHKAAERNHF